MADQKVTQLSNASALDGTEVLYAVQSSADVQATADQLKTFVLAGVAAAYQPLATVLTNTTASFTTTLETKLSGIAAGAEVNTVDTVNGATGTVVLDADDIDDTSTANKFVTASDITNLGNLSGTNTGDQDLSSYLTSATASSTYQPLATVLTNTTASFTTTLETKLNGIAAGAEVNLVDSVNSQTGAVVLDADDIDDTSTANKFVTAANLTVLGNTSGTNTGDQDLSGYLTTATAGSTYQPLATVLTNTTASFTTAQETKLSGIEAGAEVNAVDSVNGSTGAVSIDLTQAIVAACSDETTALTTGTAKVTFRMPYAFTLSAVRASVTTAPTGATITVDINESGTTILSTKLTIDATEKTSTTAATPAVISDTSLADDAEITIDIDQVGSTVAGAGLKVSLIGVKA